MFNFEKLDVWQKAMDFADLVYTLTRTFPNEERPDQPDETSGRIRFLECCRRQSRISRNDFARFVELATGSLFEVVSQSGIGLRQGFLTQEAYRRLYEAAEEQSRMFSGLRRSLVGE